MGRSIGFYILKNPSFKAQFHELNEYIWKEYSAYLESLPKKYYNEEELYGSEYFGLNFDEWDGVGYINSNSKPDPRFPEFIDYIIKFWEKICRKYFYKEVALFNCEEFWDVRGVYYFHEGKSETLFGADSDFIYIYTRLAIKGYDEPINLHTEGIDRDKSVTKLTEIENRKRSIAENKDSFVADKNTIEKLENDMLIKAKNYSINIVCKEFQ